MPPRSHFRLTLACSSSVRHTDPPRSSVAHGTACRHGVEPYRGDAFGGRESVGSVFPVQGPSCACVTTIRPAESPAGAAGGFRRVAQWPEAPWGHTARTALQTTADDAEAGSQGMGARKGFTPWRRTGPSRTLPAEEMVNARPSNTKGTSCTSCSHRWLPSAASGLAAARSAFFSSSSSWCCCFDASGRGASGRRRRAARPDCPCRPAETIQEP